MEDLYGLCILTTTLKQALVALIYSSYISVNILLFSIALNTINLSCYHIYHISRTTTMSVVLYWILLSTENDKITYPAGTAMSKINMKFEYADTIIASFPYLWFRIQYHVRFVKIFMLFFNQKSLNYPRLFRICTFQNMFYKVILWTYRII